MESSSADRCLLPSSSFRGSEDAVCGDSALYEKFLLDDLDSYWDDLSFRVTVSRMVSDSVVKGMVNAVAEEAVEEIASKDADIARLKERLKSPEVIRPAPWSCSVADTEHFGSLRIAVEDQLENVRNAETSIEVDNKVDVLKALLEVVFGQVDNMSCSVKALAYEQQREWEIEREVTMLVTCNSVRALHDEFETKLYEQRRLINTLNKDWQVRINELSNVREELDGISRSFISEPGSLLSHNSIESFEEWKTAKGNDHFPPNALGNRHMPGALQLEENVTALMKKKMDSPKPMLEDADSPKLKHMTKEEVIAFYRTEMLRMSRQHEQAVHEKTEELFKLKRDFLKEKGSSHLRKDRESEVFRKKIPEVISKLDKILLTKKKLPMVKDDRDELYNLINRIDTLSFDNKKLRGMLSDKRKEVKGLSSQISDATSQLLLHSSVEVNLLKRINKLESNVEDLKIEANIRGDVYNSLLKELINEHKCGTEDLHSTIQIMQDIDFLTFKEVVHDAMSTVNPIASEYYMEKTSLEALLSEKENVLCLALEENKKLQGDVFLLSASIKEKEDFVSEAGLHIRHQQEHFDLVKRELVMFKDQVKAQEALLADKNTELVSMESRLDETMQQIQQHELEINQLNEKFVIASDSLNEVEKQNNLLCGIVEEKQKTFSSFIAKNNEQANQMKNILTTLIEDLENRLFENIQRNESRLKILNHHCMLLTQQASLLRKKELWYKQVLEIKSSNFQMAEAEVDLLGDEVDVLMSLLGKIYIALDHYSPIFELYPGVMDILKLVQRKLKGETTILV